MARYEHFVIIVLFQYPSGMLKLLTWKQAIASEGRAWLRAVGFKSFHEKPTKRVEASKQKAIGVPGYYPGQVNYRVRIAREKLDRETEQNRINPGAVTSSGRRKPRKSKLKSKQGAW